MRMSVYVSSGPPRHRTAYLRELWFVYAGIDVPMIDHRGKMILVVDDAYAASLDYELSRLQQDLIGDGSSIIRHDVSQPRASPA